MILFDSAGFRHFVKVSVTEVWPACYQSGAFGSNILSVDKPVVTTNNQFKKGIKDSFLLLLLEVTCLQ